MAIYMWREEIVIQLTQTSATPLSSWDEYVNVTVLQDVYLTEVDPQLSNYTLEVYDNTAGTSYYTESWLTSKWEWHLLLTNWHSYTIDITLGSGTETADWFLESYEDNYISIDNTDGSWWVVFPQWLKLIFRP